ncbi:MAG: Dyp-type peroxidase [Betaproteobacteria bacterium]|nr:Dyp-type peroxidase [Betaproteobacteria bacterium]
MNTEDRRSGRSRRAFFKSTAALAAATGAGLVAGPAGQALAADPAVGGHADGSAIEPFWGVHQGGIATPPQRHVYFAAFDLSTSQRSDVAAILEAWTAAASRMSRGETAEPREAGLRTATSPTTEDSRPGYAAPPAPGAGGDTGEVMGMTPHRLTVTFGFGPSLFVKDGKDRYGLAARRPEALADLPPFPGDQLVETHSGGDLCVQACADDPQVAFHAVRQLARIASGSAQIRWAQTGFLPDVPPGQAARNLMGFKDGIMNPAPHQMDPFVWIGAGGPDWLRGGSYLVARRIRIALEHWDSMRVAFQEQVVGRHKLSGAPLGQNRESAPLDLDAKDQDGNPIIPENAHVRLSAAAANGGAVILRRGYSYNNGVDLTAERWPPWREGLEYDAGLLFLAFQQDPRTGFIRIFDKVSRFDMMNQFVTHVGSALFACPGGATPGEFIGQRLLEG